MTTTPTEEIQLAGLHALADVARQLADIADGLGSTPLAARLRSLARRLKTIHQALQESL